MCTYKMDWDIFYFLVFSLFSRGLKEAMPVNWSICPSGSLSVHPSSVCVEVRGVERGRSGGRGCMLLPACTQFCDPTLLVFSRRHATLELA